MTPAQASKPENEVRAYINYMKSHDESKQPKNKFKVGDQVRISRVKGTFEKGLSPNFHTKYLQ